MSPRAHHPCPQGQAFNAIRVNGVGMADTISCAWTLVGAVLSGFLGFSRGGLAITAGGTSGVITKGFSRSLLPGMGTSVNNKLGILLFAITLVDVSFIASVLWMRKMTSDINILPRLELLKNTRPPRWPFLAVETPVCVSSCMWDSQSQVAASLTCSGLL